MLSYLRSSGYEAIATLKSWSAGCFVLWDVFDHEFDQNSSKYILRLRITEGIPCFIVLPEELKMLKQNSLRFALLGANRFTHVICV